jgi:hypothetical protein
MIFIQKSNYSKNINSLNIKQNKANHTNHTNHTIKNDFKCSFGITKDNANLSAQNTQKPSVLSSLLEYLGLNKFKIKYNKHENVSKQLIKSEDSSNPIRRKYIDPSIDDLSFVRIPKKSLINPLLHSSFCLDLPEREIAKIKVSESLLQQNLNKAIENNKDTVSLMVKAHVNPSKIQPDFYQEQIFNLDGSLKTDVVYKNGITTTKTFDPKTGLLNTIMIRPLSATSVTTKYTFNDDGTVNKINYVYDTDANVTRFEYQKIDTDGFILEKGKQYFSQNQSEKLKDAIKNNRCNGVVHFFNKDDSCGLDNIDLVGVKSEYKKTRYLDVINNEIKNVLSNPIVRVESKKELYSASATTPVMMDKTYYYDSNDNLVCSAFPSESLKYMSQSDKAKVSFELDRETGELNWFWAKIIEQSKPVAELIFDGKNLTMNEIS